MIVTNAERQAVRAAAQREAFRAGQGAARMDVERAKRAGLVSVSTTHTRADRFEVDTAAARFTRLQKNIGVAAKLHMIDLAKRRSNVVMVTLTYRPGVEWSPEHLRAYMTNVRNWFHRLTGDRLRYVWVAEMQKRGVIHYHAIFWLPKRLQMPKADKRGWWPHGMTNTKPSTAPVAYVMSYAKKLASKEGLPHGARIYGIGGLDAPARGVRRWLNYPAFIQARASVTCRFAPEVGGGWRDRATGRHWPSEFGVSGVAPGRVSLLRLHDHGRPLADVVGPYSWASEYLQ